MPLQPPALDDRSYNDLLQEMLASVPGHTPEWSSPQPGDPGRTLLELFAWMGDALLYRVNLIPEKQRLAFLSLLGWPLQPASAARGLIALTTVRERTEVLSIAAGALVKDKVSFETLGEIDLLPVTGSVYRKAPLTPQQRADALPLLTGLRTLYKLGNTPSGYMTQPVFAAGASGNPSVDLATDTIDSCLWVALLVQKKENLDTARDAIGGKNSDQKILNIGFVPALAMPDPFADVGNRTAVDHSWQLSLKSGADGKTRYASLKVFDDTTQSLTRPGVIRLGLPQAADIGAPSNDVRDDAMAGVGVKPPRIDDPDIAQRLVAWVRLKTASDVSVEWAGINAVEIEQRVTSQSFVLAVSDGSADQKFALPATDVDPATFDLEVDMPGLGFQLWEAVDDIEARQGPAPVYTLDAEAGLVTFGNQLRGMIPPAGRRIRVRRMRSGGGSNGNLPANTLSAILARDSKGVPIAEKIGVSQAVATTGGADSETLDAAQRRIPARLRHRDRAVTEDDYRSLALEIPGGRVARVEVLPLFKPQTRATNIPGVVSVMVIPGKDNWQPPCPRPDRPMLETVYAYLNTRKPVAAELYVIGVEYIPIGISVAVEVRAGFELRDVRNGVEDALRRYLWPLQPGGAAQTGWSLGRHVRSFELDVIVSQVPGVVEVNGFNLFRQNASGTYDIASVNENAQQEVTLAAYQLPELLEVLVAAGPDGSGVTASESLVPAEATDDSTAVPVVPKVC